MASSLAASSHLEDLQEPETVETEGNGTEQDVIESLDLDYQPDHESIARLAYALWEERGRVGASPEEDWYRAEQILKSAEVRA